jgi:hypothetical protein
MRFAAGTSHIRVSSCIHFPCTVDLRAKELASRLGGANRSEWNPGDIVGRNLTKRLVITLGLISSHNDLSTFPSASSRSSVSDFSGSIPQIQGSIHRDSRIPILSVPAENSAMVRRAAERANLIRNSCAASHGGERGNLECSSRRVVIRDCTRESGAPLSDPDQERTARLEAAPYRPRSVRAGVDRRLHDRSDLVNPARGLCRRLA